jgi:VanZ family protein
MTVQSGAVASALPQSATASGDAPPPHHGYAIAAWLWLGFVIYGSLLPFAYSPQPLSEAWRRFAAMPLLDVGADGRADWLANLLLYAPLAFSWISAQSGLRTRTQRFMAAVSVVAALGALAVFIEFLQVFFPPRTVSWNDMLAEMLGALLGVLTWSVARTRIRDLHWAFGEGGREGLRAMSVVYLAVYLGLALFPFDFLLSAAEVARKLERPQTGWWLAPVACTTLTQCAAQLLAEGALAIPVGAAIIGARLQPKSLIRMVAFGLMFAIGIELAQVLLGSGVSQGASAVVKAAGFLVGALFIGQVEPAWNSLHRSRGLPWVVALLALAYLATLSLLLGHWHGTATSWVEAYARLPHIPWLPLYNYYYTSETRALASALTQIALFAPMGGIVGLGARALRPLAGAVISGAASGTIALVFQVVRLLHPPARPDPTDVLIAIVAGVLGYLLTTYVRGQVEGLPPQVGSPWSIDALHTSQPGGDRTPGTSDTVARHGMVPSRVFAAASLTVTAWYLAGYPLNQVPLVLALTIYAALLNRWPHAWLVVLPAALPLFDFAGLSGRMFWSEFDTLVLVTFAVAFWTGRKRRVAGNQTSLPTALVWLLATSIGISLLRGLIPLEALDANAFANYYSRYNALRIGKGFVWAGLLVWLAARQAVPPGVRAELVASGFTLGAAGVVALVVWERLIFSGLFNFGHEYRVTGPFWEMNTGGAAIEGYLVSTLPFVAYLLIRIPRHTVRIALLALFGAGVYAVLVTMSRNGLAALTISLSVFCFGLVAYFGRLRGMAFRGVAASVVLVSLAAVVTFPILGGAALKARFSSVNEDLQTRFSHWSLALSLRDSGWMTEIFGMGLGQFAKAYYFGGTGTRPGSYRLEEEVGTKFVRLGGGRSLYLEQFVTVRPGLRYDLSVRLRSDVDGASLVVPICEKWVLSSFECSWNTIDIKGRTGAFKEYTLVVESGVLSKGTWYTRRPVKLSLYNPNPSGSIDVADVRLIDQDGRDLVHNGGFESGIDHWHFSTDDHLPWHIKNLGIQILFDQGWLGVLAWGAMVFLAMVRAAAAAWCGDFFASTVLSGLTGFMVVGVFDSLIDGPRLLFLFCLLIWLACESSSVMTPTMVRGRVRR